MPYEDYLGVELTGPEIQDLYEAKVYMGIHPDWEYSEPFIDATISFYNYSPDSVGAGQGRLSLPYLAALEFDPQYGGCENQTTGDCVSHSTRNAAMLDYCIDCLIGETNYEGRLATENIYGARGHGGQGASCERLSGYVAPNGAGGFLVRKEYSSNGQSIDLSIYNSRIGHNWGPRGTPSWVNELASANKSLLVLRVDSWEEERDALACGWGISACSGLSFQNRRDENGVCIRTPQGWSHAMAHIGFDDTDQTKQRYGEPLVLIQNSWGPSWVTGPKANKQPDGSFWTPVKYSDMMTRYVIGSLAGYNRQAVFNLLRSNEWVR